MENKSNYIDERKKKFNQITTNDIQKNREKMVLQIRKDKVEESIQERRFKSFTEMSEDNDKFSIVPSELNLGNDFVECFISSNNKVEQALRLIGEKEDNMRKFGIRQLRNFTEIMNKKMNFEEIFQPYNFDNLVNLLINSDDLKEIFEVSFIMINLGFYCNAFTKHISRTEVIKEIFKKMIFIEETVIKNNLLKILGNIIGDCKELFNIVYSACDLLNFAVESLKNPTSPKYLRTNCIWIIANFAKYSDQNILNTIKPVIPEIAKYTRSNIDQDYFSEALNTIAKLTREDDEGILEDIIHCNVHLNIIPFINFRTETADLNSIFVIIGNLAYISNRAIRDIYKNNIFQYIETYLEEFLFKSQTDKEILKNKIIMSHLIWALNNCIGGGDQDVQVYLIRKTKIVKLILELNRVQLNRTLLINTIDFIYNCLKSVPTVIKTELLRLDTLTFLSGVLNHKADEILLPAIESIQIFLQYGETLMKERNIIKEKLETLDVSISIDNLQISSNDKIAEAANYIMEKYFSPADGIGGF